jgi:hypothetical protein
MPSERRGNDAADISWQETVYMVTIFFHSLEIFGLDCIRISGQLGFPPSLCPRARVLYETPRLFISVPK